MQSHRRLCAVKLLQFWEVSGLRIDILANNTVKITLGPLDMMEYDVSYEKLSRKSPDTRRMLSSLIDAVRSEKKLDLSEGRLFIEAFPRGDGGCMLYISSLEQLSEKPLRAAKEDILSSSDNQGFADENQEDEFERTASAGDSLRAKYLKSDKIGAVPYSGTVVCAVDSVNELAAMCVHLVAEGFCGKSAAYSDGGGYRLVISQKGQIPDRYFRIIKEYGRVLGVNRLVAAKTFEHFKAVACENAVERIAKAIGRKS